MSEVNECECEEFLNIVKLSLEEDKSHVHVLVIIGASGDLAKKKTYPTLWWLFRDGLLPPRTYFVGFARSDIGIEDIRAGSEKFAKLSSHPCQKYEEFWNCNFYMRGDYTNPKTFELLNEFIESKWGQAVNRIFYYAIPPSVYKPVSSSIKEYCTNKNPDTWTRLIIEKPFGRDLESFNELNCELTKLFTEEQIYRIDHYLGKEMVQNLLILRFCNQVFSPLWNRENIDNITISFKEPFGTEGRGGYFDQFGIIRDVVQNHLIQILSLVAMEKPVSVNADDIRDEKVRVLRSIEPLTIDDIVIGQYVADPNATNPPASLSYTDDPSVPKDSITPTYVCAVLYVKSDRWKGVPFILRAGKALNERKAEVRVQFKEPHIHLFGSKEGLPRNELVIRVQPDEAVYIKLNVKSPGMKFQTEETELDLTYAHRYKAIKLPDAYERLILDVFCGVQTNFVRSDELHEAWRILTPVLKYLEDNKVKPYPYIYGSRNGPKEADILCKKAGFQYSGTYVWKSG
ncbi:unnamed protein product [Schistosoma rodhaini]|uniref:Glucose-6-phosphate 1-dehydrogenase n=2 Tax=Schistosoma mansoni TaxID=6183 RepID=A0A5K4F9P4_SCHMA|nr:unnamed protein product [Schistosoma rodhaini]